MITVTTTLTITIISAVIKIDFESESTIEPQVVRDLLRAECGDVFAVLGMHAMAEGLVVRALLPDVAAVQVVEQGGAGGVFDAVKTHAEGLFEVHVAGRRELFSYELQIVDSAGEQRRCRDPYSFWPQMACEDQYLFDEGTHCEACEMLGAHPRCVDAVAGVYFALWAPSARRVSVVGDFNGWDGRLHCMRPAGASGLWEIFVPDLAEGALYKFEVLAHEGEILLKGDPFAFAAEMPP